jgi:glycosyltransferase involved in cell wall biosynthesis
MGLLRGPLKKWDLASSRKVDAFVAISETVQKRIKRCYNTNARIVYPPVDTERFSHTGERGDYYLLVGALVPYKRVDIAVDAFNILGYPLKIAGCGPEESRLRKMGKRQYFLLGKLSMWKLLCCSPL